METNNTFSPVKGIENSGNAKIGIMSATYVSQASCGDCIWKNNGCYAELGMTGIHTRKVNSSEIVNPEELAQAEAEAISKLTGDRHLRLHVVGDCSTNEAAKIVSKASRNFSKKNNKKVYSYTHSWREVKRSSWNGVSILASCETSKDVKKAQKLGYATAIVVSEFPSEKLYSENGINILPCPNQTKGITCVDCKLCMNDEHLKNTKITIGFKTHGIRKNKMNQTLIQIGK
jgi:hypothetical protein